MYKKLKLKKSQNPLSLKNKRSFIGGGFYGDNLLSEMNVINSSFGFKMGVTQRCKGGEGSDNKYKANASNESGKFLRELSAGLVGYLSHYCYGHEIDNNMVNEMSESRRYFHNELDKLINEGLVPRWGHQLKLQNYYQHKLGNDLPQKAAEFMIDKLRVFGKLAENNASRKALTAAYDGFQIGSIEHFLDGGSSLAPKYLHRLAPFLQKPPIILGGSRWVRRPARTPALGGPRFFIPALFSLYFAKEYLSNKYSKDIPKDKLHRNNG